MLEMRVDVCVRGEGGGRHALETLHTLRFGESCARVMNADADNGAVATRALRAIDEEIREVEEAIRRKERWETVKVVRHDELHQEDEATGAFEVVTKSVLVGAEEERERLQLLLDRRRILAGGGSSRGGSSRGGSAADLDEEAALGGSGGVVEMAAAAAVMAAA
mmetsp:Transcript_781/g.1877  ORF Transcript_781/g.1877 Transcript_781/m.1877 type:complete len:164 (+) Transcript_781:35-526(+)